MELAIIILNWNKPDITLKSVRSLKWHHNINAKIIVVDNGSEDDSVERFKNEPGVEVIALDKNYGYAQGYNLALKYVFERYNPKFVFILNNDTEAKEGTIDILYDNRNLSDIISPKIYMGDGKTIWSCGGSVDPWRAFAKNRGQGEPDQGQYQNIHDPDFASGCALWIKSEVIKKIGLFDPIYEFYYEDVDFCYRAKMSGYSVKYLPDAEIIHLAGCTSGHEYAEIQSYYRWRNRIIFAGKIMSKRRFYYFILLIMPLIIGRDVFRYLIRGSGKGLFKAFHGLVSMKINKQKIFHS